VTALCVKGIVPTDKLLIVKSKSDIPLFNLEDFNIEKYPNKIHGPEDEIQFISRWVPIDIPSRDTCIRYPSKKKNSKTRDIDCDHSKWVTNDELL
jgi:hypothetical protein